MERRGERARAGASYTYRDGWMFVPIQSSSRTCADGGTVVASAVVVVGGGGGGGGSVYAGDCFPATV